MITIGIIACNEEEHIEKCILSLLNIEVGLSRTIKFLLVDCCSTDATYSLMTEYVDKFKNCQLKSIKGEANASVARNVILDEARKNLSEMVFIFDGDIEVNRDYILEAIKKIDNGVADAVTGKLHERIYKYDDINSYTDVEDRFKIYKESYGIMCGGCIAIGREVINSGIRYDESMQRQEDHQFSMAVTRRFRLLKIPVQMGIHHTREYFSKTRYLDYIINKYPIWTGRIFRENFTNLPGMKFFLWRERGLILKTIINIMMFISLCLSSTSMIILSSSLIAVYLVKDLLSGGWRKFFYFSLLGSIYFVYGVIRKPVYTANYKIF